LPLDPPLIPAKLEAEAKAPFNPSTPSSFELPHSPVKVERRSLSYTNPSPNEVALQEIMKLQAKQVFSKQMHHREGE